MNEKLAVEDLIAALRQSTVLGSTVIPVIKHVWTEQVRPRPASSCGPTTTPQLPPSAQHAPPRPPDLLPAPVSAPAPHQSAALLAVAQTKAFSVGHLVGFDWKLGVATEANTLTRLETPYVTLALRVADPNGAVSATSVTLTVSEFKVRPPHEPEPEPHRTHTRMLTLHGGGARLHTELFGPSQDHLVDPRNDVTVCGRVGCRARRLLSPPPL